MGRLRNEINTIRKTAPKRGAAARREILTGPTAGVNGRAGLLDPTVAFD
jgi:hypothetical protein